MALQILTEPPEELAKQAQKAIEEALPGAQVYVQANSPGHIEVEVTSGEFANKSKVAQQQLVYRALKPLMAGSAAPLHAVDQLRTQTP